MPFMQSPKKGLKLKSSNMTLARQRPGLFVEKSTRRSVECFLAIRASDEVPYFSVFENKGVTACY